MTIDPNDKLLVEAVLAAKPRRKRDLEEVALASARPRRPAVVVEEDEPLDADAPEDVLAVIAEPEVLADVVELGVEVVPIPTASGAGPSRRRPSSMPSSSRSPPPKSSRRSRPT